MAIKLSDKPNTVAPNSDFPYGDIRDNSGINNGTPVNREVYGDFHQFFEKLMKESGIEHNGLPDNATNGFQLFEALMSLFAVKRKIYDIGEWNMNSVFVKAIIVPVSILSKVRGISVIIESDSGETFDYLNFPEALRNQERRSGVNINKSIGYVQLEHSSTESTFALAHPFSGTSKNRGWVMVDYV